MPDAMTQARKNILNSYILNKLKNTQKKLNINTLIK
jgi:hypothetical protein